MAVSDQVPEVSYEDLGPMLEEMGKHEFEEQWPTLDPQQKSDWKNALLDLMLPGVDVMIANLNEQLAAIKVRLMEEIRETPQEKS